MPWFRAGCPIPLQLFPSSWNVSADNTDCIILLSVRKIFIYILRERDNKTVSDKQGMGSVIYNLTTASCRKEAKGLHP